MPSLSSLLSFLISAPEKTCHNSSSCSDHDLQQQAQPLSGGMFELEQPVFFIPTMASWYWLVAAATVTLVATRIFFHHQLPQFTTRQFGIFNLMLSLTGVFPFVSYFVHGVTWTGTELSDIQRFLIDHLHAFLMLTWSLLSVVQVVAIIFKARQLHRTLGKIGLNILLPIILTELNLNAAQVFLPDKPYALAQGHWTASAAEPTVWQTVLFCFPLMYALLTTVTIGMYWWLSRSVLHDTTTYPSPAVRHRLHMLYSTMLIITMVSAGVARWWFKFVFRQTGCPTFTHDIISVRVQQTSVCYNGLVHIVLMAMIYATMPLEWRATPTSGEAASKTGPSSKDAMSALIRNDKRLRYSFYAYLFHAVGQILFSFLLDMPFAFRCNPDTIEELLMTTSS